MLVTSIFSFFHNNFKRPLFRLKSGLCCKGLNNKRAKMALDRSTVFLDCSSHFFLLFSEKNLQEFLYVMYSARSLHSLIPCLLTDQNFTNNSEKGHSRNISMRLFQNLTNSFREDCLGICLCSYSQVVPIHQSHVHGQIKISTNDF